MLVFNEEHRQYAEDILFDYLLEYNKNFHKEELFEFIRT